MAILRKLFNSNQYSTMQNGAGIVKIVSNLVLPESKAIFKGLAVVYASKMLSASMWALATIVLARVLGPYDYGLLSVFMTVLLIALIFLGKNLDTGLVKYYDYNVGRDPDRAGVIIRVAFKLRIIASIGGSVAGYLLSNSIAIHVFHNAELIFPLKMAFIAALGASLWFFTLSIYQAKEEFLKYSVLEIIFNFMRSLCIVGLLFAAKLTLENTIIALMAVIYLNMVLGFIILPRGVFKSQKNDMTVVPELIGFCKWILLTEVIYIIYSKLDILILNHFREPDSVGIYSAAFTALVLVEHLIHALLIVQLPAASKLKRIDEYERYIRRSLTISAILSICILPLFFLAEPLIITFFSESYYLSVSVFRVLFFAFAIRAFTHPLYLLFLSIGRPEILAAIFGLMLVLTLFGNLLFVKLYGEIGAAWVTLVSRVGEGILICYCIYRFVFLKNPQVVQKK